MKIAATTLSLNVTNPQASADFASRHFGYAETMSVDGVVALSHPDSGLSIVFLRTGLSSFRPTTIAASAGQGLLIVFTVDDLDSEFERITAEGALVVTEPETEPWGERYCQLSDSNGIVWQLVQWV